MDPDVLIEGALAKIESADYAGALVDLEAALRLDPENLLILNSLALARVSVGDYQGAIDSYNAAIARDAQDLDARLGCAEAHIQLDNLRAAVDQLRAVLALEPENQVALGLRAASYEKMGQHALAARDLSEMLRQNEDDFPLRLRMARSLARADLLKEAIAEFDHLLEIDQFNVPALYDRGVAHMRLEQFRHAVNDFSLALDLDPNLAPALQNRGNCLLRLEMVRDALLDYDRLIKQGDNAVARFNRGLIHRRLGNANSARVDFAQAVAIDPQSKIADRARRHLQSAK